MSVVSRSQSALIVLAMFGVSASGSLAAQPQDRSEPGVLTTVYGQSAPDAAERTEGPQIEGIIPARKGDQMQVTTADGTNAMTSISADTRIKSSGGLLG